MEEDLQTSLESALELENAQYNDGLVFHAYWTGELSIQHLISITTCWYFNIRGRENRKIILWLENCSDSTIKAELQKFVEIREFDFDSQVIGTPFAGRDFYAIKRPAYFSDVIRYILLYKFGGLWFDLDNFFLRSLDPVLANFSDKVFLYRWSNQEFPNGAIYFSPKPEHVEIDKIINVFLEKNIGFGFNETQVGFDTDVNLTVLPCAWFDPAWLENNYIEDFSHFFYTNKKRYNLKNFFPGAFAYHWHNRWNFPVKQGSIISDLYQEVLSNIEE